MFVRKVIMSYIHEIAPLSLWSEMVKEGYVKTQFHPTLPYVIYDYSEIAQYERVWNPVTLASRGLIVDYRTGFVVSHVLSKFFNYGEQELDSQLLSEPIIVSDKLDGSAGYSYPDGLGLSISTRGSFTSDQALHATDVLKTRYEGKWLPDDNRTYLWEIIYPQNRIVVNYSFDDIVLLAAIDNTTGISMPASEVTEWLWRKTEEFPYSSLDEVLVAPERNNVEGFVVHFRESDVRVKIKQEDYVALHKIVTGLNKKRVWEVLSTGTDYLSWVAAFPDEFVQEIELMTEELNEAYNSLVKEIDEAYATVVSELPVGFSRKDFALKVTKDYKNISAFLFSKLAEQDLSAKIWKRIEPDFEKPVWGFAGKTGPSDI
jgi:RNA ligase